MPAQSDQQRRFMGAILSYKLGKLKGEPSANLKKAADSMTTKQVKDYLREEIDALDETPHGAYTDRLRARHEHDYQLGAETPTDKQSVQQQERDIEDNYLPEHSGAYSDKQRRLIATVLSYKQGKEKNVSQKIKDIADKVSVEKLEKYLKNSAGELNEADKYGRGKLFNISAMKELIDRDNHLKAQYDSLKEKGKQIFGYHYNEIILSFIFLRDIKPDKDKFKQYLEIKSKISDEAQKEKERAQTLAVNPTTDNSEKKQDDGEEKEEIKEVTSGSSGAYSGPSAFAKNDSNWRNKQAPLPGYKNLADKDNVAEPIKNAVIRRRTVAENTLIDSNLILESLFTDTDKPKLEHITIETINGKDYNHFLNDLERDYAPDELNIVFVFDKEGDDLTGEYKIKIDYPSFRNYIRKMYDVKDDDDTLDTNIGRGHFNKVLEHYIFDHLDEIQKDELNETAVPDKEEMIKCIAQYDQQYTVDQLNNMSEYDLLYIYNNLEIANDDKNKTYENTMNESNYSSLEEYKQEITKDLNVLEAPVELIEAMDGEHREYIENGYENTVPPYKMAQRLMDTLEDEELEESVENSSITRSLASELSKLVKDKKDFTNIANEFLKKKGIKDKVQANHIVDQAHNMMNEITNKTLKKYRVTSGNKKDHVFEGHEIEILGRKRIQEEETGRTYPMDSCAMEGLEESENASKTVALAKELASLVKDKKDFTNIANEFLKRKGIKDTSVANHIADQAHNMLNEATTPEQEAMDKAIDELVVKSNTPQDVDDNLMDIMIEYGLDDKYKSQVCKEAKARLKSNKKEFVSAADVIPDLNVKGELQEDALPAAITQLNRIKKDNDKENNDYFDSLKTKFDHAYDDKGVEDEISKRNKYNTTGEIDSYEKDQRGRGAEDLDYSYTPDKTFLERMRKNMGNDATKQMIKTAHQRKLEREYQRDVKTEIQPDETKHLINLNRLDEAVKLNGMYVDKNSNNKFVTITATNSEFVEAILESTDVKRIKTEGMGNTLTLKAHETEFGTLNENKNAIKVYDYFYDTVNNKIIFTSKQKATSLDEGYKNNMKKSIDFNLKRK